MPSTEPATDRPYRIRTLQYHTGEARSVSRPASAALAMMRSRRRAKEMALGRELSDDLIADVLRRLPPRTVAVSRCACRAWRDLIDDRRLLRKDLLPRTVGGIFINYCWHDVSEFLARPTAGPSISGDLESVPGAFEAVDHCNGLLLWKQTLGNHGVDCVANPATRRWTWLPLPPQQMRNHGFRRRQCLVYDPAVSPHYHVLLIGSSLHQEDQHKSALQIYAYSSETGRWEERWFAPEVPVVQTTIAVADDTRHNKAYWRGRLYLLCENRLVLRISISNANYRLIPTPALTVCRPCINTQRKHLDFWYPGLFSLGRSEKGLYCAVHDWGRLRIFLLNEACGQIVWELRHSVDLKTVAYKLQAHKVYGDQPNGPWVLEDIKHYKYSYAGKDKHKKVVEDNFDWNSDDDNVFSTGDMDEGSDTGYTVSLLGFHPYKEVVFFNADLSTAVAYHWNTSKLQDLGDICPIGYLEDAGPVAEIETSFIYTPCWMEEFPKNSLETPIEG